MGSSILVIFRYYKQNSYPPFFVLPCGNPVPFSFSKKKKKKKNLFFFSSCIHALLVFVYTAAFSFQNKKPISNFTIDKDLLEVYRPGLCSLWNLQSTQELFCACMLCLMGCILSVSYVLEFVGLMCFLWSNMHLNLSVCVCVHVCVCVSVCDFRFGFCLRFWQWLSFDADLCEEGAFLNFANLC